MALANYTDLKNSVANWLHRSDLTANIPDFITMAEVRLARDLRVSPLITSGAVTIAAAGNSIALPTGMMEVVKVKIASTGQELQYVPPDTIDRLGTAAGTPWIYTLIGGNIQVAPSWTAGGNLTVLYVKKETALSDSTTTNWYITNAPDALLYASLLEASPYLMNDNRVVVWKEFYKNSIEGINGQYGTVDPHKRMLAMQSGGQASNLNAG